MTLPFLRIAPLVSAFAFASCESPAEIYHSQNEARGMPATFLSQRAAPYGDSAAAPVLVKKSNGHYRVARQWVVVIDGRRWNVQKGYVSNGITAPSRIKRSLGDSIDSPETWAAVFHDWLFTQPGISRAEADRLFYQLLTAYGVPDQKARLMYSFVATYSASKVIR